MIIIHANIQNGTISLDTATVNGNHLVQVVFDFSAESEWTEPVYGRFKSTGDWEEVALVNNACFIPASVLQPDTVYVSARSGTSEVKQPACFSYDVTENFTYKLPVRSPEGSVELLKNDGGTIYAYSDNAWIALDSAADRSAQCLALSTPLPTVFYTKDIAGKLPNPNTMFHDGDVILNLQGNAVYRYHTFDATTATARIYVYQCRRRSVDETVADPHGGSIGQIVGNFVNYTANTVPPSGSQSTLYNTNQFYNDNNAMFINTPLQLVADFEMSTPFLESNKIYNYINTHASEFPKLQLTDGNINDVMVVVKFKGKISTGSYKVICMASHNIDNGCCVLLDGENIFEFWAADCWLSSGTLCRSKKYLNSSSLQSDTKNFEIYMFEQGGGEACELLWSYGDSGELYNNFHTHTVVAPDVAGGEWVYEGPIAEMAYTRNIEASGDAVTTVSSNTNLSYQTLDVYAKPGDIHIKTPSSVLNVLTSTQIWKCKYSRIGQGKQLWEKLF